MYYRYSMSATLYSCHLVVLLRCLALIAGAEKVRVLTNPRCGEIAIYVIQNEFDVNECMPEK